MTPLTFSAARIVVVNVGGDVQTLVPPDNEPTGIFPNLVSGAPVLADPPGGDPTYVAPGAGVVQLVSSSTAATIEYRGPTFPALSGGGFSVISVEITVRANLAGCAVPASSWHFRCGGIQVGGAGICYSGYTVGNANAQCASNGNIGVPVTAPLVFPGVAGFAVSGPGQWRQVQYDFYVPRDGATSWAPYMAWIYISGGNLPELGYAIRYLIRT
jgi:hypothetical protein